MQAQAFDPTSSLNLSRSGAMWSNSSLDQSSPIPDIRRSARDRTARCRELTFSEQFYRRLHRPMAPLPQVARRLLNIPSRTQQFQLNWLKYEDYSGRSSLSPDKQRCGSCTAMRKMLENHSNNLVQS